MKDDEVGRYWDQNADAWTALSRNGFDIYRDGLNTPAFLQMLPDIKGLRGLDIGCGEGSNTRLVRERCADMSAIDVSSRFIEHAQRLERDRPAGIAFQVASAQALPFADATFDFATSFMCLMDLPDHVAAFSEAHRVLKPGGFFQFSITHPCYDTPYRRNLRNDRGETYAIEVGRYFDRIDGRIDRWLFGAAPRDLKSQYKPFEVPRFHRTLSEWLNMIVDAGFAIERVCEPRVSEEFARSNPALQDTRSVAYFLHVRCRKNA
jgi:ubiquinone/menaquinone biosynthesis C-methylase UbiE